MKAQRSNWIQAGPKKNNQMFKNVVLPKNYRTDHWVVAQINLFKDDCFVLLLSFFIFSPKSNYTDFIINITYLELIEKILREFLSDTNHMPWIRISWITHKPPGENMLYRLLLISGD